MQSFRYILFETQNYSIRCLSTNLDTYPHVSFCPSPTVHLWYNTKDTIMFLFHPKQSTLVHESKKIWSYRYLLQLFATGDSRYVPFGLLSILILSTTIFLVTFRLFPVPHYQVLFWLHNHMKI